MFTKKEMRELLKQDILSLKMIKDQYCVKNIRVLSLIIYTWKDYLTEFLENTDYTENNMIESMRLMKNTYNVISDIIRENNIDYSYLVKNIHSMSKFLKTNFQKNEKHIHYNERNSQISYDMEMMISYLKSQLYNKHLLKQNCSKYGFLLEIINQPVSVDMNETINYIFISDQNYVNVMNNEKEHIVCFVVEKYLQNLNTKNEKIYFNLMNLFLDNRNLKLTKEDQTMILQHIKHYKTRDLSEKKISSLKALEKKVLHNKETVYCKEDLENLKKQYNKQKQFSWKIKKETEFIIKNMPNLTLTELERLIVTIDGDGTLCRDDALSIYQKQNGNYLLNIYITDVPSIIKSNNKIMNEAYKRVSSLYLVDNCYPLFPKVLSNHVLSLNVGEYKQVITCSVEITKDGEILKPTFSQEVINVSHNLTYSKVNHILENGSNIAELYETLKQLSQVTSILKLQNDNKYLYRNMKNFQKQMMGISDVSLSYDNMSNAEIIVEETMVLMNCLIAKKFREEDIPICRRVLPSPDSKVHLDELKTLRKLIQGTNYMDNIEKEELLSDVAKLYPYARYSKELVGHHGIGVTDYCHATSPARRYADDVVQYGMHKFFFGNKSLKKLNLWDKKLDSVISHVNEGVATNQSFEREYNKIKKYM